MLGEGFHGQPSGSALVAHQVRKPDRYFDRHV
jgi:hypothetical protein